MRQDLRHKLAKSVREHRTMLDEALLEVADRGTPMTKLEARLIAEIAELRLAPVEQALAHNPILVLLPRALQRFAYRVRGLMQPRLGRLQHYPPKPLEVPRSYFNIRPPAPAPLITIVTPSYQHGRFIERTIRSVVDQGYPELEYIVQDGGSTDGTVDILERLEDRITRWVSAPDGGHADALNRAFRDTTGEIMGWLNSDDLLLPGTLAYVAGYFATHPDVDVVYGNRVMIDENDEQIGVWVLPAHDDLALTLADFIPQETLFWRRRVWAASGGSLDKTFGYALDWDLLLRFRDAHARMVRLPRFLGAFRVHDAQRTSASHELGVDEMARLRERVHGQPVPLGKVNELLQPYLRRHVQAHLRQRFIDRLPQARVRLDLRSYTPAALTSSPSAFGVALGTRAGTADGSPASDNPM